MSKEMTAVSNKEPLMHISKRDEIDMWKAWAIRLGAVLLSLVVCAGVIYALTGLNPLEVYKGIFDGAVGTKRRTWMTIRDTLVHIRCHDDLPGQFTASPGSVSADAFGKRPVSHGLGSHPGIF